MNSKALILIPPMMLMGILLLATLAGSPNKAVPAPNIGQAIGASQSYVVEPHATIRHPECQNDRRQAEMDPSQIEWWNANCTTTSEFGEGDKLYGIIGNAVLVCALVSGFLIVKSIMTKPKDGLEEYAARRGEQIARRR